MIRYTVRTARRRRRCDCGQVIEPGDRYAECVASPHHGDLANPSWWRLDECVDCGSYRGRGHLFTAAHIDGSGAVTE